MRKTDGVIQIFQAARRALFATLEGISREDLDWSPRKGMRGVGEICRHLYRVDIWFLKRMGVAPAITLDEPGPVEEIASRMRAIQEQTIGLVQACESDEELFVERSSRDKSATSRLGPVVVHMAHHYLYHVAQIAYLRRIRDPEWPAPLKEWEDAAHLIGDHALGLAAGERV